MKVGLSLSRCVRDVVEARVLYEDILCIIARTDFDPHNDAHWNQIWDGYNYGGVSHPEWAGNTEGEEVYRNVIIQLYDGGKIHQPRRFGNYVPRLPYYWLECIVPENEMNPTVKKAWEHYQTVAGLSL
jgi:hypothetical protein